MTENNRTDIFEEYVPYVGACETTDKEKLLKVFKCFLDNPAHFGTFCVRWKENEDFYNNETFADFYDRCTDGVKRAEAREAEESEN